MAHEVVYREKYGSNGKDVIFKKCEDVKSNVLPISSSNAVSNSLLKRVEIFFKEVFLPQGFPDSVSKDYWNYQVWDSVQAFCSTLAGTLTTQAVLRGVGVGSTDATPLSAAITWILKDGTGMIGRILFAWRKGTSLDADCKKWRLFADVLNDTAMLVEMFVLPMMAAFSTGILCVSTTMKAIVGVAGGATKATTTQHQAIRNNMGDVLAKDGSQETCLNLVGSICGIFLLTLVADNELLSKAIFLACLVTHVFSNYRAVKALSFETLNEERLLITLRNYICYDSSLNCDPVNSMESVVLGLGLKDKDVCGFHISIGNKSLTELIKNKTLHNGELNMYLKLNEEQKRPYMVVICARSKVVYVLLNSNHSGRDILMAYFHSVVLGVLVSIKNNQPLKLCDEKSVSDYTLLDKIYKRSKIVRGIYLRGDKNHILTAGLLDCAWPKIPVEDLLVADFLVASEFDKWAEALEISGWKVDQHHLPVGEWRAAWGAEANLKSD